MPIVLSRDEVSKSIKQLQGLNKLQVQLMYGCGMRSIEVIRLRIQDIDFSQKQILIRSAKGNKDRVTFLPDNLITVLNDQIEVVTQLHNRDLDKGFGEVLLPGALARKYKNAGKELRWQYLFPSISISKDPRSGKLMRHHIHKSAFNKALNKVVKVLGISKRVTSHVFRHYKIHPCILPCRPAWWLFKFAPGKFSHSQHICLKMVPILEWFKPCSVTRM